jgi:hypothetical protein
VGVLQRSSSSRDAGVQRLRVKIDSGSQYAAALCRLAYHQGVLQGDLNDLQQFALLVAKGEEFKATLDAEWRTFKYMSIAAHPEEAASISKALDDARAEADARMGVQGVPEFATPIGDEEVVGYESPAEYDDDIVASLREFGVVVREIPD